MKKLEERNFYTCSDLFSNQMIEFIEMSLMLDNTQLKNTFFVKILPLTLLSTSLLFPNTALVKCLMKVTASKLQKCLMHMSITALCISA